jgi:hypothetical protein
MLKELNFGLYQSSVIPMSYKTLKFYNFAVNQLTLRETEIWIKISMFIRSECFRCGVYVAKCKKKMPGIALFQFPVLTADLYVVL